MAKATSCSISRRSRHPRVLFRGLAPPTRQRSCCAAIALLGCVSCVPAVKGAQWLRQYSIPDTPGYGLVARAVLPASDGGFHLVGCSLRSRPSAESEAWVLKLDGEGGVLWAKRYRGTPSSCPSSAQPAPDGGIVLAGTLGSAVWVMKVDSGGNVVWQKVLGGAGVSLGQAITATSDGSLPG